MTATESRKPYENDRAPQLNDTIETEVNNPYRHFLRVKLVTHEAVEYARGLIACGRWRIYKEGQE